MSPQVFNKVLNGATFYAIKPFPSQSQTKRKNWVKFLFSHFFVVPQKVLWKTIIKQIGLFWLKSVYLICYLETVTLVLAISLIFLFILSIIIGNFLYRYITACLCLIHILSIEILFLEKNSENCVVFTIS